MTVEEIGSLTEPQVRQALMSAYRADPTICAAWNAGASDARLVLILLVLLDESRKQCIELLSSKMPPFILEKVTDG